MRAHVRSTRRDVRGTSPALAFVGVAVAGFLLLQAGVSHGAPSGVHIEDQAGDANGVNTQGEYGFGLGVATEPAQLPEADLLEVDLRPARRGYSLSFHTSAPAATGYVYGITAEVSGCRRMFIRQERAAEASRTVVYGCGYEGDVVGETEQQRGNTLRVNIPRSIGALMAGGTRMRAETLKLVARVPGGTFAPVFIDTASPRA